MSLLRSLQDSAFTDWFLGSDSVWTYPTFLMLHTVGLAMLVGASLVVHLRVLNVGANIPFARLRPLYRFIWIGFSINLVTGLVLFVTQAGDRAVDPVFYIKMASVALAFWLGFVVRRRVFQDGHEGPPRGSVRAMAAVALLLWTSAIVSGRLIAYLAG
jgi:hypothetical protein